MKKTLIAFTIAAVFFGVIATVPAEAATLHTILVGDTTDDSLGTAFRVAVQKMHDEATAIANETGLSLTEYIFIEQDARVNNVMDTVKSLKIEADDVVMVYMAIHGYRNPNKTNPWPSLYFGFEHRGLDFHYLNKKILEKKPRLLISVADSCNNFLDFNFPTVDGSRAAPLPYSKQLIESNYSRLFMEVKGSIIVSSSLPGEYSWAYPGYGGLWTLEFLKTYKRAVYTEAEPDWNTIMKTIADNVIKTRTQQNGPIQHAQYEVKLQKAIH